MDQGSPMHWATKSNVEGQSDFKFFYQRWCCIDASLEIANCIMVLCPSSSSALTLVYGKGQCSTGSGVCIMSNVILWHWWGELCLFCLLTWRSIKASVVLPVDLPVKISNSALPVFKPGSSWSHDSRSMQKCLYWGMWLYFCVKICLEWSLTYLKCITRKESFRFVTRVYCHVYHHKTFPVKWTVF